MAAARRDHAAPGPHHRAQAFPEHQCADGGEQRDIGQRDHQVELAECAKLREGPDAERGAEGAAGQQHRRQRRVNCAPSPVGYGAGKRRRGNVAGNRGDRDRGRDADEDQKRRHQEAAADAEHPRHEADRRAHREDEKNVDGHVGDREIKLHGCLLLAWFFDRAFCRE